MDEQEINSISGHHQLDLDESESKSPLSQESGLCSTMLVNEESMGSLDELSESVHQQLDSHIDQASILQYEVELLRSQLTQKNRVIATQQATIKQLQEALLASQREVKEVRRSAQNEITCKNETINILQSDLVDCQQQYAECFQQVVQQDRILAKIRDDDVALAEKIAFLEKQLRHKLGKPRPVVGDPTEESRTPVQQLKEIMSEIREIQSTLHPKDSQQTSKGSFHQRSQLDSSETLEDFWNAIAEERQQRIKLDHVVRQMELDLLEVKNQVQSCKARISSQQVTPLCVRQSSSKICCPLMEQAIASTPVPRSSSYPSTTFYTLV